MPLQTTAKKAIRVIVEVAGKVYEFVADQIEKVEVALNWVWNKIKVLQCNCFALQSRDLRLVWCNGAASSDTRWFDTPNRPLWRGQCIVLLELPSRLASPPGLIGTGLCMSEMIVGTVKTSPFLIHT